jgi:L-cysteine:1D-myo-inositol 2-amino-2-deoxy-alpha-D-glucopyranoside ligase
MSGRASDSASVGSLRLFNTATGELGEVPNAMHLGVYVCGITPYAAAHVGHATVYLTYDLLIRRLRDRGRQVTLVRNITDVDDSILDYAREHGLDYAALAAAEVPRFASHMAQLNIDPPDHEPRATQSIGTTVELIQELEKAGVTYAVDGDIYFDTAAFGSFGSLSKYPDTLLIALAKARGDNPNSHGKRNPLDFVLWKRSSSGEPSWGTTIGTGRPGWHVGCTAMSLNALGSTIDIHGGGKDLVFPHHESKRAIAEAVTGEPFVAHWVHTAVVNYAGEKMSKSLGNLIFVGDILRSCEPMVLRLALMSHHYRDGFEWDTSMLNPAREFLAKLRSAVTGRGGADPRPYVAEVRAALDDDLNGPRALCAVADLAASINQGGADESALEGLLTCCRILGIDLRITPFES